MNLVLLRLRMTPEQVRALAAKARPLTPEEVRRAALRLVKKGSCGRGGLPAYVVEAMYADYLRTNSLAKAGKIHGRSRQAMWEILTTHGKKLTGRRFYKKVVYKYQTYTPGKDGYLRQTDGDRRSLAHVVWEDHHGPIPDGHQVKIKNGDISDCRIENMELLPRTAVLDLVRPTDGRNQFTPAALLKRKSRRRARLFTNHV